ncbi:uncharacterized protein [Henckelia pumila]|uniref:uncharacterized protein n=1 Tax=Henckelia pumila TaxID=405737 RepID=UPI003C6DE14B
MARKNYLMEDASKPNTAISMDRYMCCCCKRCARKRQTRHLPPELVFQFLLELPAQALHHVMRRVCREWNLIVHSRDFIHHHLRNSTSGVLIQDLVSACNLFYVEMRRGCLEICKLDWGFEQLIWTSCNGLVLVPDSKLSNNLCLINPLTKQQTILPPYFGRMVDHSYFVLVFAEASMEYKVVRVRVGNLGSIVQIVVLTIGVDEVWRCIDVHLVLPSEILIASMEMQVTGGYVHWFGKNFILTFNAETEAVRLFPRPPKRPKLYGMFLAMGSNLSYVTQSDVFVVDVWEMNLEMGEWIMMLRLDLKPVSHLFEDLSCELKTVTIYGWLEAREVLVFGTWPHQRHCIAYNVKTREIQSIEFCTKASVHYFQAHVNSLVGLVAGF